MLSKFKPEKGKYNASSLFSDCMMSGTSRARPAANADEKDSVMVTPGGEFIKKI